MGDDIDAVVEEVIVDAYGHDEQLWAFRQFFEDEATLPFPGHVVGAAVEVVGVDYDGDERRGLVAVCRRDGTPQRVSLHDVVAGAVTPRTAALLAAYRRWSGSGAGRGVNAGPTDAGAHAGASGPERWTTLAGEEWCWFDLWFCVLAVADFGGDLDRLEAELAGRLRSPGWTGLSGSDVESKLSHLGDLRARMAAAGVEVGDLDGAGRRPGVVPKARSKILNKPVQRWSMTPAMAEPPRVRLERRARRGHWGSFPVDPAGFYEPFRRSVEVHGFIHEDRTLTLTGQLWDRLCRLDDACPGVAERLALYRAFHTAGLELADNADDSYGVVGDLRVDAFEIYVDIDWAAAGMPDEAYWQDLCELLVWEPYSLTWQNDSLPFKRAKAAHAELIEGILLSLADEHRSAHLDRHADEALALAARLHIAARRYRRYAATAGRLHPEQLEPVIALAESALRGHKLDVAVDVFRAAGADGRGGQRLRERCLELTGVSLDDERG